MNGFNAYVPWDVSLLDKAVLNLRDTIGTAFNIGIWIFMILSAIYLVIKIVDSFGN